MTRPRVLVVIPALDEAATIEAAIASLSADLPWQARVSFVVVDGGSSDGTQERVAALAARRADLSLLHNPARIQAAAVNLAARAAAQEADVIVRCDAHAVYPRGYVARLLEALERTGADSVVVPLDSIGGPGRVQRAVAWVSDTLLGSGGAAHRAGRKSGFVDHGHHAAFRAASFRRCGGYDESYSHNEDAELDCRLRRLGGRIYLDARIRVGYVARASLAALARQYFRYGRGRSRTVRRHPGSMRARQLAVPAHAAALVAALAAAPWWPPALAWPLGYLALLALGSAQAAWRHRSACGLLCGPAAAVMHLSWAAGFFAALRRPEPAWEAPVPSALLVDPSLFTAPYDAALTQGLLAAGVAPKWLTRPLRPGERDEIPPGRAEPLFYRRADQARWIPAALRPVAKGLAHFAGLARLVWKVRREKPDVVHVQWAVVPLLDAAALALARRHCPVVLTLHDTVAYNGEKMSAPQRLGHGLPARLADRVIVHTRSGRERLAAHGVPEARIAVIPHGPLRLAAQARAPAARDRRWTAVLFGEIKPYKGLDVLVEAAGRLAAPVRAGLRVVVAGRPRMALGELQSRIGALGLAGTFELRLGRLSEEEMAALFAEADGFVFPYRQIDASGVYYLVKPLGKWLIASRVGIFAEDMRGEEGALVAPGDAAALARALEHAVLRRPRGRAQPFEHSWTDIGLATRSLYEEARAEFDARRDARERRAWAR
jgi:glycosyltransferase involved in cell wall biosynthesis/GT2 family glycosyltransferase